MRKTITKIICVAAAAISAAGLALASGCANWTTEGVPPDNYTTVTSNGGFAALNHNSGCRRQAPPHNRQDVTAYADRLLRYLVCFGCWC